jgi:hypothetical protein
MARSKASAVALMTAPAPEVPHEFAGLDPRDVNALMAIWERAKVANERGRPGDAMTTPASIRVAFEKGNARLDALAAVAEARSTPVAIRAALGEMAEAAPAGAGRERADESRKAAPKAAPKKAEKAPAAEAEPAPAKKYVNKAKAGPVVKPAPRPVAPERDPSAPMEPVPHAYLPEESKGLARYRAALAVQCPTCKAKPQAPCVELSTGKPMSGVHGTRESVARRAAKAAEAPKPAPAPEPPKPAAKAPAPKAAPAKGAVALTGVMVEVTLIKSSKQAALKALAAAVRNGGGKPVQSALVVLPDGRPVALKTLISLAKYGAAVYDDAKKTWAVGKVDRALAGRMAAVTPETQARAKALRAALLGGAGDDDE